MVKIRANGRRNTKSKSQIEFLLESMKYVFSLTRPSQYDQGDYDERTIHENRRSLA